ncbi:rhomboid family intramembrane serine protease [Myxococcota bacterium]|nr:rhomboid family intramembrane serine protease [Myxococcota bacterium]MBU1510476.1 rhomboid family intramembrane serine protease [Myxococcota bacterium]
MKFCPCCALPLEPVLYDQVELDICRSCGGVWLDGGEGAIVIGPAGDPRLWERHGVILREEPSEHLCPVDGAVLAEVILRHGRDEVTIEVCPECRGIRLDAGEGARVQSIVTAAIQESPQLQEPGFWSFMLQAVSGIPIEVWNPVRRRPWLTIGLVVTLTVVFLVEFALHLSFGDAITERIVHLFGYTPGRVWEQPWTLVTYGMLHGGWLHLVGNIYFLYVFGDNIEDRLGRKSFLTIYFMAVIAGALAQHLVDKDTPVVGASGAIAGLMGAYLVLFPRVKVYVVLLMARLKMRVFWYMGIWVGMQFLIAAQADGEVAWMVHLGGFFAGVMCALFLGRRGLDFFIDKQVRTKA